MGYPNNMDWPAFDRAITSRPEIVPREPSAAELDLKARVQALLTAVENVRQAARVFDRESVGDDALQAILIDTPAYCADLLAAISALPLEEANTEEVRLMDEEKWG